MATASFGKGAQELIDIDSRAYEFHRLLMRISLLQDPKELARFSLSECDLVRCRVAQNSCCTADTLQMLSVDCHAEVRAAVALNPHTPHPVLSKLAQDSESAVRMAVAQSLDTNIELLRELALDTDSEVSAAARRTFKRLTDHFHYNHQHGHPEACYTANSGEQRVV